jgi:serine/threonine protein phosphatase PrpC
LFGVFDGHGGREVAIYCNLNYQKILKNSANLIKENGEQEWLRRSFLAVDDELRTVKG